MCLAAWLSTPWHLAVELHDHLLVAVHGHSHAYDHDHDHDDAPGPERGHDSHDAGDHLLPDSLRASPAPSVALDLAPRTPSTLVEPPHLVRRAVPPRADAGPTTDPPDSSRRPRAPPVG